MEARRGLLGLRLGTGISLTRQLDVVARLPVRNGSDRRGLQCRKAHAPSCSVLGLIDRGLLRPVRRRMELKAEACTARCPTTKKYARVHGHVARGHVKTPLAVPLCRTWLPLLPCRKQHLPTHPGCLRKRHVRRLWPFYTLQLRAQIESTSQRLPNQHVSVELVEGARKGHCNTQASKNIPIRLVEPNVHMTPFT